MSRFPLRCRCPWIPATLTSTNRLPSLCPSSSTRRLLQPTLQCAQRQIVFVTKFAPPQSAGFEFRHQLFDLLAASPLPNANLSDFCHADSASKTAPSARWVALTDTLLVSF